MRGERPINENRHAGAEPAPVQMRIRSRQALLALPMTALPESIHEDNPGNLSIGTLAPGAFVLLLVVVEGLGEAAEHFR
jgi:hypothetical protein